MSRIFQDCVTNSKSLVAIRYSGIILPLNTIFCHRKKGKNKIKTRIQPRYDITKNKQKLPTNGVKEKMISRNTMIKKLSTQKHKIITKQSLP